MLSEKMQNRIFDMFLGILLCFSLVYTLESSLNLRYPLVNIFLFSFLLFILYSGIFLNRLTAILSLSVLGLGIIASIFYITYMNSWRLIANFSEKYFYWLAEYIEYFNQPNPLFTLLTVLFFCIVVSLFVYIFGVKHFVFPVLLVTGAAIFGVQWINEFITDLKPFYIFTFAILIYYLRYVFNKKQAACKNVYVNHTFLLLCMLPVCVAIIYTASLIHTSSKPLEWKWLDNKVVKIYDYFDQRFDYKSFDYFSVASGGFSQNDGTLGGRVRLSNTPVLTVKAPKRVYLRGSIKDVYTGSSWKDSNPGKLKDVSYIGNDYYSPYHLNNYILCHLISYSNIGYIPMFCTNDTLTVKFEKLKTKTIFVPLNYDALYVGLASKNILKGILSDENGALSTMKRNEKDFTYSLSFYNINYSDENLISVLKKCTSGLSNFSQLNFTFKSDSVVRSISHYVTYDKNVSDYICDIRSKYLQLPEQLPQRVRDLSLSITEKYNNDYEKAKAIEKYLSGNFPYTLDAKALPHNRDFVDYFLFDQKKGYCTYYASAMTVMARSAGVPARYVEGYMLPPTPNKEGYYTVTNMNAHAWVEVFLEGFGWVPFEPTAPFVASFYASNKSSTSPESTFSGISTNDQYQRMMERFREDSELDPEIDTFQTGLYKKQDNNLLIIKIVAAILLLLLLSFLLLNIVNVTRHKIKLNRISGMSPKESVISAYEYYLKVLSLQKFAISPGETPFTYSKRIDLYFTFYKTSFNAISRIFAKARYSTLDITEGEKFLVNGFREVFLSETKSNTGKFKYFVLKNVLGKI